MGLTLSNLSSWLFGQTQSRLCMLGLDCAGKTTVLYKLKLGEVVTTIPTIGFNVEEVHYKNLVMTIWDVGGQKTIRNLWKHYLRNNDALLFVVDSTDKERFAEAREELWSLLESDDLRDSCLLVLANKQDLPRAANPSQVTDALELMKLKGRPWFVQACCASSGEGLVEGLEWVAGKVREKNRGRGWFS